ncbi:MAG: hypothetical protein IPG56_09855 [Caulobacteraceae bacterium]|nr:hypothetical protein [Caulobacteraceae bacterium]
MTGLPSRAPSRNVLRTWGLVLAVLSVILPALPLGPLFAQPPMPLAVLWAAYGWAAEDESGWRAPLALALLGLAARSTRRRAVRLVSGIYLSAYLIGPHRSPAMSAPNLVSLWGGFIGTALFTIGVAWLLAPLAFLGPISRCCRTLKPRSSRRSSFRSCARST